jgi:error-prone DNA polymerase
MTDAYVELHARSAFSFLEGASQPEDLLQTAATLGLPALALLDRDGVYGAARFHTWAKKLGVKAHIGAEVSVADAAGGGSRLPLLCASRAGYQNLCRMITRARLRHGKKEEHVWLHHPADVEEFSSGLIALTGDERGPLATALARGGRDEGRRCLERMRAWFGRGNVYVELQRHHSREQEARNQAAVALARECGLPLLATNGVSHAAPRDREVLDALTCIRHKRTLESAGRLLLAHAERHLRAPAEMARLFADLPEAIAHSRELSARLDFSLADLGYRFPRYPVPAGETMQSFLRDRTWEGARRRYRPLHDRARRQIERELGLIEKLDLAGYFLIVWDLVEFCRRHHILAQGRGSAANSAVCYALGITAVDPVGMDLLFERFLSEERGEWPDIDLDLPSGEERERVIQYVYQRYGPRGAAMTANVITYRGRSAAREMGKVLGLDAQTLARLTPRLSAWEWPDPRDTLERHFTGAGLDLRHPRIARFLDLCARVRELPRHLGQHSGGMVICQGQLDAVVPLEPATMPGRVVVQWDKDDCADLGIIKVDLLGLGMMAVLKDSLTLIRRHYGEDVDLAALPPDDPATYAAIQKADTVGMFQIESRAQMSSLPRNAPSRFYDLVVQVALIRPGPIVGQMTSPYLKRRMGREAVVYPHPALEPVLERTLGVPLFQEQLLRMAMICADFTGGEAEELRRALGTNKRVNARMRTVEERLRAGMTGNGITGAKQDEIVQFITSFALYGFPESHAASFALLAYASAYLKTHYLAAFTAALLNHQPMGFYDPATLVKDAQRHGLRVLPVDIRVSLWPCTLERVGGELVLRLGFGQVRSLRRDAAEALVAERARAPFVSLDDLARRVPALRREELNLLAEIGALNPLVPHSPHRRTALWEAERAARPPGPLLAADEARPGPSPLLPMTPVERLRADFHGTGLTVGSHPAAYHRARLQRMHVRLAQQLAALPHGATVRVAGSVIARQRPGTAKGFLFLSLEDESGIANVILRPDVYDRYQGTILHHGFLLVEGRLQHQEGVISVRGERVQGLAFPQAAIPSHDFH